MVGVKGGSVGSRVLKCNQIFNAQIYLQTHNNIKLGQSELRTAFFSHPPSVHLSIARFTSRDINCYTHPLTTIHLPPARLLCDPSHRVCIPLSWHWRFEPPASQPTTPTTNHNLRIESYCCCSLWGAQQGYTILRGWMRRIGSGWHGLGEVLVAGRRW